MSTTILNTAARLGIPATRQNCKFVTSTIVTQPGLAYTALYEPIPLSTGRAAAAGRLAQAGNSQSARRSGYSMESRRHSRVHGRLREIRIDDVCQHDRYEGSRAGFGRLFETLSDTREDGHTAFFRS